MTALRAPFVWFGGKQRVADVVWRAFGNPPNFVEPFAGSVAVLLARPGGAGKIETVNDLDSDVANFWRATSRDPDAVAAAADWPLNEVDLRARAARLLATLEEHRARMVADADYFDPERAGIWAWGQSSAIGSDWMDDRGVSPSLGHSGRGLHRREAGDLRQWFRLLRDRLRRVRVACGDFERVLTGAVTGSSNTLQNMGMGPCAVFLDPAYVGVSNLYAVGSDEAAARARDWAVANGDNPHFRIALCGYADNYDMPASWNCFAWKAQGGHANRAADNDNRSKERIWFSPHCLPIEQQPSLFGAL